MPCCGKKRNQMTATQPNGSSSALAPSIGRRVIAIQPVRYRYEGQATLTVVGSISRSRYHFAFPGATLVVDGRDAPSLTAVPLLRWVRE